ncbi:hypothetical protein HIM_07263 [Hirsutella minnesotensis 3608]|uniref:Ribosomal protein YmL11, mitochondrial n=1 Tax=Hirsutella minnesotensis 3608 TaxID=1043627 RepID=A0A0F8A4A9_9HYPO|nr:hypothetical protein HIM_07263 [Hirsutella minnesotensis 3608]
MTRKVTRAAWPCLRTLSSQSSSRPVSWSFAHCRHFSSTSPAEAAKATAAIPRGAIEQFPVESIPSTKPLSARPVETRKSQLIRTYTSLLRTSPLILFFQHSNLTAVEWVAVRRELKKALSLVSHPTDADSSPANLSTRVQLQVIRTNMFDVALKIVEFHNPETNPMLKAASQTAQRPLVHDLSQSAYETSRNTPIPPESSYAQIQPLMVGPLAALVLPAVSPAHLAAALSVLAPVPGKFPAPSRKKNPGYHEATCQNALAKLVLVGGRIEGKIFDQSGVVWVGGIQGGMDGLRNQLLNILQGAGLGITNALEGGGRNIWLALEGRKIQLEEESK